MLNTEARKLLDKYLSGNKDVSLGEILKKQISIKRLPPKKTQCKSCIYRDCIYNNTKEADVPGLNDWKAFHKFSNCFGCEDRKEQ